MKTHKTKTFKSIILYSILLSLGTFGCILIFYSWNMSNKLKIKHLTKTTEQLLEISSQKMAALYKPYEEKVQHLSSSLLTENYDSLQLLQTMSKIMKQDTSILSSFIYYMPNDNNPKFEKYFCFQKDSLVIQNLEEKMGKNKVDELITLSNTTKTCFWQNPYYREIDQRIEAMVCCPIYNNSSIAGIVGLTIFIDNLFNSFHQPNTLSDMTFFILSEDGVLLTDFSQTVSIGTDLFEYAKENDNLPFMNTVKLMMNGEKQTMQHVHLNNNENLYVSFFPLEKQHISIGLYTNKNTVFSEIKTGNIYLILLFLGGLALTLITVYLLVNKRMQYLSDLSKATEKIGQGIFNTHLPDITTNDDFFSLKNKIQLMQQNLSDYTSKLILSTQNEEQKKQEQIQYLFFKNNILEPDYRKFVFGNVGLLEFKINYHPAKKISGDFFDYFFINESKICMVFGNVAGKGITLPLFISFITSNIRNELHDNTNLVHFVENFNKFLFKHNENQWIIKLLLIVFDSKTKIMNFVNIGFENLYIIRNQIVATIDTIHGLAIGVVEDAQYSESTLEILPNDTILSCSNIVPNLLNKQGVNFGKDNLEQLINQNKTLLPTEILQNISEKIELHLKGIEPLNDYSLMAIKILEKTYQ